MRSTLQCFSDCIRCSEKLRNFCTSLAASELFPCDFIFSLHHGKFPLPSLLPRIGRLVSPADPQNHTKQRDPSNLGSPPLFSFQHIHDSVHLDSGFGVSFQSKKTLQASTSRKRGVLAWSVPQKESRDVTQGLNCSGVSLYHLASRSTGHSTANTGSSTQSPLSACVLDAF